MQRRILPFHTSCLDGHGILVEHANTQIETGKVLAGGRNECIAVNGPMLLHYIAAGTNQLERINGLFAAVHPRRQAVLFQRH
ncbi:MAG TPA: hypothetical protein VFI31_19755 [Pirellulales bacterium]|nr:hypothetical protein [Pirellulales bacterium]